MTDTTTPATVDEDGHAIIQVANSRIARLIALGVHAEREAKRKAARRRLERQGRRNGRKR